MTRRNSGGFVLTGYAALAEEARLLSRALASQCIGAGDRVATISGTFDHHLALWYAISGMGAVTHPLNPRLARDQLARIANQTGDRILFVDPCFTALAATLAPNLASVQPSGRPAPSAEASRYAVTRCGDEGSGTMK